MQVSVTLTGELQDILHILQGLPGNVGAKVPLPPSPVTTVSPPLAVTTPPPATEKRGRKPKTEKAEPVAAPQAAVAPAVFPEDLDETEAGESLEMTDSPFDLGFEEPPPAPVKAAAAPAPKLSLEKDVIPAFQSFAKRHSREKASNILGSLGVRSVRDLKPEQYAQVIGMLNA